MGAMSMVLCAGVFSVHLSVGVSSLGSGTAAFTEKSGSIGRWQYCCAKFSHDAKNTRN